jgi:hypothetical protein
MCIRTPMTAICGQYMNIEFDACDLLYNIELQYSMPGVETQLLLEKGTSTDNPCLNPI